MSNSAARIATICALLSVALCSAAQTGDRQESPEEEPRNRLMGVDRGMLEEHQRRVEEHQQQLGRRLADPIQRAQLRAERLAQLRASQPDLGRVLGLDTATEAVLWELLMNQKLAAEMRPSDTDSSASPLSFDPKTSISPFVLEYNQQMQEIGRLLGSQGLDAFVDYQATLQQRQTVEHLNAELSSTSKLSAAQKDEMVMVLAAANARRSLGPLWPFRRGRLGDPYVEISQRQMNLDNLAVNEASVQTAQREQRELLQQVSALLTPEQSSVFAAQQQRQLDQGLAGIQKTRRSLGLGPEEKFATSEREPPAPPLTGGVRLTLQFRLNDVQLTKTVVSQRGAPVSFAGPDGLTLRVRPFLIGSDAMMVQVEFLETVGTALRKRCEFAGSVALTNPRGQSAFSGGIGSSQCLGRKGYDVVSSGSATYL